MHTRYSNLARSKFFIKIIYEFNKMPKPQKMHPKARGPPTLHKPDGGDASAEESARSFELELCWCIQQLEKVLAEKKLSEKQLTESWKVLTVLKNNSQPLIRKRQLMRTHFGDYRAKMATEEKKLIKMANSMKIVDAPANPKATFIRRSAFLSTGDDSFRFNFELSRDQLENADTTQTEAQTDISETHTSDQTGDKTHTQNERQVKIEGKNETNESERPFKFSFSNSAFKFNFAVDS